jgi:hypothetical protein
LELLDVTHPFRTEVGVVVGAAVCSHYVSRGGEMGNPAFVRFGLALERVWNASGIDYRASRKHKERLVGLGFEGVESESVKWPLGEWARHPESNDDSNEDSDLDFNWREMGMLNYGNFMHFMRTAGRSMLTGDGEERIVDEAVEDLERNCVVIATILACKLMRTWVSFCICLLSASDPSN